MSDSRHADTRPSLLTSIARFATLALALSCIGASPLRAQASNALATFLRSDIALSTAQLDAAARGEAVVKVLETNNQRDVAVFGLVTVDVPRQAFVRRLRDFRTSLRSPTRTKLGFFGDPPSLTDVRDITVDDDAVAELRKCKPGSCNFKMPASDMSRVRQVLSSGSDERADVAAYVRQRMVEYATDYRARGNAALVVYDDRGGTRASDAFAELLASSPYLYRYVPKLHEYLRSYPNGRPLGVTDALVWYQDEMPGLRPILGITHVTLYDSPELAGATILSAKQLYANHYFEAAFDLTTLVDRQTQRGTPGVYLLVLRRYRFDNLPSGGLINIRGRVVGKLRDAMHAELVRAKRDAER
ncbi:MAG TPA: hypothetical protein VJ672_17375 [Gemmatimonadaceae bacterium]|nr:hypothetical protein [Gemmatimonadaceae bacterium]